MINKPKPTNVCPPMYLCLSSNVVGFLVQDSDREDVGELKQELLALMLAMHERIQSLEVLQDQQNLAIQVCPAQSSRTCSQ